MFGGVGDPIPRVLIFHILEIVGDPSFYSIFPGPFHLQSDPRSLHRPDVPKNQKAIGRVRGLGNQVVDLKIEGGEDASEILEQALLPDEFIHVDRLGLQVRIGFRGKSPILIIELVGIGSPEGTAVKGLQGGSLQGIVDQGEPWVGGPSEAIVMVIPQTNIQNQALEKADFILGKNRPDVRSAVIVEVEKVGVFIIGFLPKLKLIAVLSAEHEVVALSQPLADLGFAALPFGNPGVF
jgi:hypothetical protein